MKEADETRYWLDLLHDSDVISDKEYEDIYQDASKIVGTLIKIIKKTKENSVSSVRLADSTCPSVH